MAHFQTLELVRQVIKLEWPNNQKALLLEDLMKLSMILFGFLLKCV